MQQIENILGTKGGAIAVAVVAFFFAAVLVLIIVRMLFGGKLRLPGGRARQARLGIVDAFDLDRQRQLIIIRRDNTEHLILIGGPNDLLIEPEIVRVEAREFRNREKEPGFGDARIPAPFTPPRPTRDKGTGRPAGLAAPAAAGDARRVAAAAARNRRRDPGAGAGRAVHGAARPDLPAAAAPSCPSAHDRASAARRRRACPIRSRVRRSRH